MVIVIIAIIIIILIGLVSIIFELNRITDKYNFASEYLEKFIEFVNSKGKKTSEYNWLILKSEKMQSQLGRSGLISYKMAGSHQFIPNYPVILNFIPDIKSELDKNYILSVDNFNYTINQVRECLLRHIGVMEEFKNDKSKEIRNPIIWFREGFKVILILPFSILNQLNLLNDHNYYKIKKSHITKFIASLITLLGFISSIMTISLGYVGFINLIKKLF